MDFLCPSCQKMLTVPDQYAGTKMKCPLCGSQFAAPSLPSATSAPSAGPFSTPPPPPMPSLPTRSSVGPGPSVAPPPPPPPGDYRGSFALPLDPRVVMWIAPAALIIAFIVQLFFSYTGMYPGDHAVYTQGAWGSAFGMRYAEENPLWDKLAEQYSKLPLVTLRAEALNMQFFMILYVLIFFPLSLAVAVVAAVMPLVTLNLPPIVDQIKPWRWAIAGGVGLLPLLFLVGQMIFGFGLEQKVAEVVEKKTAEIVSPGSTTADPKTTTTGTMTNEDKTKLSMLQASIQGGTGLQRTTWLKLTVFLHVLAVIAAGLMFWLDRRAAKGKPVPRLDVRW